MADLVRQWASRLPWAKPAPAPPPARHGPRPSTPRPSAREAPQGGLAKTWANVQKQWREIRIELRKVTWPTATETRNLTIIVVAVSVGVGLSLGAIDLLLTRLFTALIG